MTDKTHSIEDYILSALISWLQLNRGVSGASWIYDHKFIGDIPAGYTASVRIELRRLGGEPEGGENAN